MKSMYTKITVVVSLALSIPACDSTEDESMLEGLDADVQPSEEEAASKPRLELDLSAHEGPHEGRPPVLPLAMAPKSSEGPDGKECCALCNERKAYHSLWGVSSNCNYWAYYWCAPKGGLKDAAWLKPSQCLDP